MDKFFLMPKLYIWPNQLLLLGSTKFKYRPHMTVSDKLMVCMEGEMTITLSEGTIIKTRSCLVKAGSTFEDKFVDASEAVIAIYYLAPLTQDCPILESQMFYATEGIFYGHPEEADLITKLLSIRANDVTPDLVYEMLREFVVPDHLSAVVMTDFDPRVITVLLRIRATVRENLTVEDFAKEVHLSESRLEKLFKEQIGIPIRKYRLRYRVFISILHLALGTTVTDAALFAGFSSSAHFSKSFSSINGVPPSEAFLKPPFMNVYLADDAAALVSETEQNLNYG